MESQIAETGKPFRHSFGRSGTNRVYRPIRKPGLDRPLISRGATVALLRLSLLAVLIAGLSWFQFFNTASAREVSRDAVDLFDPRPARQILFIGTSRMSTNDLPAMVRAVADSAGAPVKYQVRMWAPGGRNLIDHAGTEFVQRLLAQRWDRVILQAQSREQMNDRTRAEFAFYGRRLVALARESGSPSSLVVNWTYGEQLSRDYPGMREEYHDRIQRDHRALAGESGAALVNVGRAWRQVEAAKPGLALTTDGNHPSVAGTYVYALMVYAHLSGADVRTVRFVPDGVSEAQAEVLREIVADHLASAADA
jgi:hypothetical protein